jgi:hypothetical protein
VLEGDKRYLLPVKASDSQWYRNVLKNRQIRIDARGAKAGLRAKPITESDAVKSVIDRFHEKYGAKDAKKSYSKFDVAVASQPSELTSKHREAFIPSGRIWYSGSCNAGCIPSAERDYPT